MTDPVLAKWQRALADITDDNADRRVPVAELRRLVEMAASTDRRNQEMARIGLNVKLSY